MAIASFAAPQYFVRYWTRADKGEFWLASVCPLLTQSGHSAKFMRSIGAPSVGVLSRRVLKSA
jgi:hypothetical protein